MFTVLSFFVRPVVCCVFLFWVCCLFIVLLLFLCLFLVCLFSVALCCLFIVAVFPPFRCSSFDFFCFVFVCIYILWQFLICLLNKGFSNNGSLITVEFLIVFLFFIVVMSDLLWVQP